MGKQYVVNEDYTVCAEGARQAPIIVRSQHKVYSNGKLVATGKDRMGSNYNCLKMLSAGTTLGCIVGGIVTAAAMAAVGGLGLAVVGLVGGGIRGAIQGNVAGKLLSMIPCICSCLTRPSDWSSVHERVRICGNVALMPDAKLNCLFGGLISVIKPDWGLATDMAKLSYFAYERSLDGPYDTHLSDDDDDLENELQSEKLDGYTKVNPEEVGLDAGDLVDKDSGFKADVYRTKDGDYVLVFRGTSNGHDKDREIIPGFSKDWVDDDIKQGVGLGSEQYEQAIKVSIKIKKKVGKENLVITGHSLGGGLATAAGAATGCETYAYNPAGVHTMTYLWYDVDNPDTSKIHTYYAESDFLNLLNNNLAIMPNSSGERICIATDNKLELNMEAITKGHDLPLMIKELSANKSDKGKVIANHD